MNGHRPKDLFMKKKLALICLALGMLAMSFAAGAAIQNGHINLGRQKAYVGEASVSIMIVDGKRYVSFSATGRHRVRRGTVIFKKIKNLEKVISLLQEARIELALKPKKTKRKSK